MSELPDPFDGVFMDLQRRVRTVRRTRLRTEFGHDPDDIPDGWRDPLLGYCHENAVALASHLYGTGYDPILVWGGLNYDEPSNAPSSVAEANKNKQSHFWVEVDTTSGPIIMNLATEVDDLRCGDPLTTLELPDTYVRLPDSRFQYHPEITSEILRTYEGYTTLVGRGLLAGNSLDAGE